MLTMMGLFFVVATSVDTARDCVAPAAEDYMTKLSGLFFCDKRTYYINSRGVKYCNIVFVMASSLLLGLAVTTSPYLISAGLSYTADLGISLIGQIISYGWSCLVHNENKRRTRDRNKRKGTRSNACSTSRHSTRVASLPQEMYRDDVMIQELDATSSHDSSADNAPERIMVSIPDATDIVVTDHIRVGADDIDSEQIALDIDADHMCVCRDIVLPDSIPVGSILCTECRYNEPVIVDEISGALAISTRNVVDDSSLDPVFIAASEFHEKVVRARENSISLSRGPDDESPPDNDIDDCDYQNDKVDWNGWETISVGSADSAYSFSSVSVSSSSHSLSSATSSDEDDDDNIAAGETGVWYKNLPSS